MDSLEISLDNDATLQLVPKWKSTCVDNRQNSLIVTLLIGGQNNNVESFHYQVDYFFAKN